MTPGQKREWGDHISSVRVWVASNAAQASYNDGLIARLTNYLKESAE